MTRCGSRAAPITWGCSKRPNCTARRIRPSWSSRSLPTRQLPGIRTVRTAIAFHYRKDIAHVGDGVEDRKTDTGRMKVSSPALAALELLRYRAACRSPIFRESLKTPHRDSGIHGHSLDFPKPETPQTGRDGIFQRFLRAAHGLPTPTANGLSMAAGCRVSGSSSDSPALREGLNKSVLAKWVHW